MLKDSYKNKTWPRKLDNQGLASTIWQAFLHEKVSLHTSLAHLHNLKSQRSSHQLVYALLSRQNCGEVSCDHRDRK